MTLEADAEAVLERLRRQVVDARPRPDADSASASMARSAVRLTREPTRVQIARWARAAGADTHPGGEELKHWALHTPEGLAHWATKPHPWTELYQFLLRKMKGDVAKAKKTASRWFIEHFGYAAGSDIHRVKSGRPPRGKVIGPG